MKNNNMLQEYESFLSKIEDKKKEFSKSLDNKKNILSNKIAGIEAENSIVANHNNSYAQKFANIQSSLAGFKINPSKHSSKFLVIKDSLSIEELMRTDILKNACKAKDESQFNETILYKISKITFYDAKGYSILMHSLANDFVYVIDVLFKNNAILTDKDVFLLVSDLGDNFIKKVTEKFNIDFIPSSLKNFLLQQAIKVGKKDDFDILLEKIDDINKIGFGGKLL